MAAFMVHEMDAVKRHEWRVLPVLRLLPDRWGETVFIWAHLPLFFLIFLLSVSDTFSGFRVAFTAFAVIHVGLHVLYRNHPAYEFNNPNSWSLIILTGALGAIHLILLYA